MGMADTEPTTHIDTDRARAGSTPHIARYVLAISTILLVVIFALIVLL